MPLHWFEYMWLLLDIILEEIIIAYNLTNLGHNGWVYIEIRKGMYGFPQAGILANKLLTTQLNEYGYKPSTAIPGLWKHRWRPVWFSLVVDDFGVKYVGQQHIDHLLGALK